MSPAGGASACRSSPKSSPSPFAPTGSARSSSPSNARNDIVKKMLTYQRARVPHYWLIEPITEALVVYRWTEAGYLLVQSAQRDERIRAEPFNDVSLSVRSLLEGDETDD